MKRIDSVITAPLINLKGIYSKLIQKMRPLVNENALKIYYDVSATFSALFFRQEKFLEMCTKFTQLFINCLNRSKTQTSRILVS